MTSLIPLWVRDALDAAAEANKYYIGAAILVYIVSTLVYAARTYLLSHRIGIALRFIDSYIAYLFNIFVNNITPGAKAGGELARAAYIARRASANITSIINIIAFERATEAIGLSILSLLAIAYGIVDLHGAEYLIAASVFIIAALLLVYHYWDRLFEALAIKLERRGWLQVSDGDITRFKDFFHDHRLFIIGVVFGVTVWFMDALRLYIIGRAVGAPLPLIGYIGVSIFYAVIGILAFTPGGLGIVEGGLTAILAAFGVSPHDALAITLIERLISYGLGTALGALGLMMAGGKRAWKALRSQ